MSRSGPSDRLFLEDICSTLQQKLAQKIVDDPKATLPEQDFQDFEVGYSIASQAKTGLRLRILYPFLGPVLQHGSQDLLERVWEGLPLQLQVDTKVGHLTIELDSADPSLGEAGSPARRHCAQQLSSTRNWLLIGPLVERIRWLREATVAKAAAAATAAPGCAARDMDAAGGKPPALLELQVRRLETCWIVSKHDRVLVVMSIHLDDEVDVALGRAFCQEFAETNRKATDFSLPCTFSEPKDPPNDLRGCPPAVLPNVGFLTLTLSDQCVRDASEERLYALALPVMTFRNFFHFHLKHAKSYLHSRLRKRLDGWQQMMNRARRAPRKGQEVRRTATGKQFVPPPAVAGSVMGGYPAAA
mmetsp:Transcript_17714/g.37653  ORF Transcript_17714/g.37653 Transcript_17714/m.37653 type:complete len:358 (+) Transcript_17714:59-1132(+)